MSVDEIELATQRVRNAEAVIERQQAVVARLKKAGLATDRAVALLEVFEDTLKAQQHNLAALLDRRTGKGG